MHLANHNFSAAFDAVQDLQTGGTGHATTTILAGSGFRALAAEFSTLSRGLSYGCRRSFYNHDRHILSAESMCHRGGYNPNEPRNPQRMRIERQKFDPTGMGRIFR